MNSIQEGERLSVQQPAGSSPIIAGLIRQQALNLRFGSRPGVQQTIGRNQAQRGLQSAIRLLLGGPAVHGSFRLGPCLFEQATLHRAARPADPTGVIVFRLRPFRPPQSLNGLKTGSAASAAGTMENVEVIALIMKRRSARLLPLGSYQGDSFAQPRAAISGDLFRDSQRPELRGPSLAAVIVCETTSEPAQALRFNGHQDGLTTAEDLVGSDLARATAAVGIENRQQSARTLAGGAAEPTQFRPGRRGRPQDHCQEKVQDCQAHAAGLARGGEFSLFVPVHNDGGGQPAL